MDVNSVGVWGLHNSGQGPDFKANIWKQRLDVMLHSAHTWNKLSTEVKLTLSVNVFKSRSKTMLPPPPQCIWLCSFEAWKTYIFRALYNVVIHFNKLAIISVLCFKMSLIVWLLNVLLITSSKDLLSWVNFANLQQVAGVGWFIPAAHLSRINKSTWSRTTSGLSTVQRRIIHVTQAIVPSAIIEKFTDFSQVFLLPGSHFI